MLSHFILKKIKEETLFDIEIFIFMKTNKNNEIAYVGHSFLFSSPTLKSWSM